MTKTDPMAKKMSKASVPIEHPTAPKRGERFRCDVCGMELEITADCKCRDDEAAHFECCGQELSKEE